ncbi:MAG: ribonuclease III [Ignavibacteriales bacterium]|nr:Ribonuclease 3 [Ignavibacteriaceae bacterium]MBW7873915.1 ribonuclease III [Ignavibacteria bacterium]MBZ0198002.1 ribonuclease III [Ignavibacteriaceae bacterium]MCZ2143326.1 ribonuclease III [Ignavibacteriales bacterium]WKZ72347.1 MAG: ribonuclease III [Ignavibacteriaceae bacterium]
MFRFVREYFRRLEQKKLLKKKDFRKLEELIGKKITNPDRFIEALTHRSALDQTKFKTSNERLEFLGDAVLGMIVAEALFEMFPQTNEGLLTKMRSNLVNKNNLFEVARVINLYQFLFIQEDLISGQSLGIKSVLADATEALIGAIYTEYGYEVTKDFILKYVLEPGLTKGVHVADENFKSQLLELIQKRREELPKYYVVEETGPEHDRVFTVRVAVGPKVLGEGQGRNKKSAEQSAAKMALERISDGFPTEI